MADKTAKISIQLVKDHFNDPVSVIHYTRAAHKLGLWKSEELLVKKYFTDKNAR